MNTCTRLSKRRKRIRVRRIITGLLLMGWIAVLGYFVVFPLMPNFQNIRAKIADINLYSLSYNATTQFFVTVAPPNYNIVANTPRKTDSNAVSARGASMEYVDPNSVEIAGLSEKDTVVRIDAANIDGPVVDGLTQESMLDGFWHYPLSGVPGKRGNTVIFGHRFHRIPPYTDTFFNLDKVAVGDRVIVEQKENEYLYTVVETKVVDKNAQDVLRQTGDYRLTLITCTPLWTADKRLVVIAVQDRISSVI